MGNIIQVQDINTGAIYQHIEGSLIFFNESSKLVHFCYAGFDFDRCEGVHDDLIEIPGKENTTEQYTSVVCLSFDEAKNIGTVIDILEQEKSNNYAKHSN